MSSNIPTSAPISGDNHYAYSIARSQQPPDLTPYSAVCSPAQHSISLSDFFDTESDQTDQVSSFNLPAKADANLYTPVSMTNSPTIASKANTAMNSGIHTKLSPSEMSPTPFEFLEEEYSPRDNAPMKPKSYSALRISMGPESPGFYTSPPPPYYGSFGVSAPPKQPRSPPSTHASPRMQPASQSHNNIQDYRESSAHHSSTYRLNTQAPVLIAPNPSIRRPAIGSYRPNSLPSSKPSPLHSLQTTVFSRDDGPNSSRVKKGQKKAEPSYNDYYIIKTTPELCEELNDQELFILDQRYEKGLQWKEVAKVYTQKHTKKTAVAALQMRRRRLMERLATRAYEIASCNPDTVKWAAICKQLQRYLPTKSSRDAMQGQKKWDVNSPYGSYYDVQPKRERTSSDLTIESFGHDSWSDERESTGHSLHDSDPGGLLSGISSATMDDVRSRAASDASMQLQLQQQQEHQRQQHQSLLYAQQQQHGWGPR